MADRRENLRILAEGVAVAGPRRVRKAQGAVAIEDLHDPVRRREFLTRMGAALALTGLGACTRAPREQIVPYAVQPPEIVPGRARYYATASVLDGYATGLLVESHEGRPTKVEGNPEHPASRGSTSVFEQASVLGLYDPSRARACTSRGAPTSWQAVRDAMRSCPFRDAEGEGLALLLAPTSSPTVAAELDALRRKWPRARIYFHSPTSPRAAWEGARIAYGRVLEPRYALSRADVIVALDADFLVRGHQALRLARAFADRRAVMDDADAMNRLYAVEPLPSVTGCVADHRLAVPSAIVTAVAASLAKVLGAVSGADSELSRLAAPAELHAPWLRAVARDLEATRGRSVIIAGDDQPPVVHALTHAINAALGNVERTVTFGPSPILDAGASTHELGELTRALEQGEVDTLVICGVNAVYAARADLGFGRRLARARQTFYVGLHHDETSASCTHFVPEAHFLEAWADARAFDGTLSIVQPLIEPMYQGKTVVEVLAAVIGEDATPAHDKVRATFDEAHARDLTKPEASLAFRKALKQGFVANTATGDASARLAPEAIIASLRATVTPVAPALELVVRPDLRVFDGRFEANAWLLELPSPITQLTWTNAAMLGPQTAMAFGVTDGDVVELRVGESVQTAPVCIVPGQAEHTLGLTMGWGREKTSELARGRGANAFALMVRGPDASVTLTKTGRTMTLPVTQHHHDLEGRDESIAQHATLATFRSDPRFAERKYKRPLSLYDHRAPAAPNQWAMAVDLSRCTGCGVCTIACQAENNIPTVGPEGIAKGRAMHWIRIDRYHVGDPSAPERVMQPMLCQHCEKAPCEYVCPVNATVHSSEGLNEMVYNRCVGTRFCSNNCPYKVRRFNWFDYHQDETATEELVHNPDVTVRERGVMEKCSFCVQRLREHGIRKARGEAPREVQTACQQACPSRAIVFGDLTDPGSEVSRMHRSRRTFAALDELGTVPRVRYLAKLRNPNPELE